jgi:DNA-binding response OmpR family regulator
MPEKDRIKTILVIEDEKDIRNLILRILELEGYRALEAGDGKTGLEIIKKGPVDMVILDIRLPGIDGWDVLYEIRRNPIFSTTPVIILTATVEIAQRRKALKMGANLYLIKPLSAHILSIAIKAIMKKRDTELQLNKDKTAICS